MENGGSILSEPVQVYFAGPKRYLVLPNPIKASLPLTVISNNVEESTRFFLFDFMGKVVLEQALDENRVQINLPSLATGYYVWQVIGPTLKGLARGKLLVLE